MTTGTGDMWDRYDQLYKKYQDATKENNELEKELNRLKDQQKLISMKKSALGGDATKAQQKSKEGYQLLHVLLVAIVCLIIGALINK